VAIQGFWPKNHLTVAESNTMFFSIGNVREEFAMDEHYIGHARNRPAPLFRVGLDCDKGYMVLVRIGDKEHPKPYISESIVFTQFCLN